MAKRKRINVRLVVVLAIVGLVVVVAGLYGAYKTGLYRKIIRINPVEAARKAEAAKDAGDYKVAERQFIRAINATLVPKDKADYYYRFARMQLDWLTTKHTEMNDTERAEHFGRGLAALRNAIVQDPAHVDAQRLLTELMWNAGQQRDWMMFIKEADALLTLDPNDHKTTFMRALAWGDLARAVPGANSTNAIRDFRRAIELKKDDPVYHMEYARFLQMEGRVDEAVPAFEEAIAMVPDDGDLRVRYAALLLTKGMPDQAMAQIQQAIQRDPNNPTGNLALADQLLKDNKTDEALVALAKARKIDDSDYRVYSIMSVIYRIRGDVAASVAGLRDGVGVLDAKLAETPTTSAADNQARRVLENNRAHLLGLLGNALIDDALGTAEEAARAPILAQAKETLDRMASGEAAPGQREKLAGRLALVGGDVATAQPLLEQAYASLGPDRQVADGLVRIYLAKRQPGKAEQILDTMRRVPGMANDPRILLGKAQLELQYGNPDEANRYIDQVLRADPKNADALRLRQSIGALRGEGSVNELLAGAEVAPTMIAALAGRAQELWGNDQRDEAIALMERLHAKVPSNTVIAHNLLAYYVGVENLDKAKALLAEVKAAHPERTAVLELQEKFIQESDRQKRYELALQMADQITDPAQRAMEKATHAARYGDSEGQGKYLREAYQLSPDQAFVVEAMMDYAVRAQDWTLADECVAAATQGNLDKAGGKVFAGRVALARGDAPKAIEYLTQAVNEQPDSKYAWVMLGDCYNQIGDVAKAEAALLTVAKADPTYLPALMALAVITEQEGRMADHAGWIDRAYRLAPGTPYVLAKHLQILESQGSIEKVIAERERLLRQNPSGMDNRLRLARLYENQRAYPRAEELYRGVYTDTDNKLVAGRMLAGFYIRTRRAAEADKLLSDLVATWPDKIAAYLVYAEFQAQANPDQAQATIAKAIAIDPKDPRGLRGMVALLEVRGDWPGTVEAISKYLEVEPNDASAAQARIRYRVRAGQLDPAEQELGVLLAANPSDANLLTLKGNLAMRQGNVTGAIEAYDRAIQIDGTQTEALLGQASALLTQGKTTEAKMALTKAKGLSADPTIAMALANLHTRLGDAEMAAMVLREVLSRPETGDYAPAMKEILRIYEQQQRWPKVAELLAEAKTKFPTDPYYPVAEARMFDLTGNRSRAVAAMEAALKLSPESQDVLRGYLMLLAQAGDLNKVLSVTDTYKDKPSYGPVEKAVRARALAKLNRTDEAEAIFLDAFKTTSTMELPLVTGQLKQAFGLNVAVSKMAEWVRTRPDDSLFYLLLGELYVEAKSYPQAIESYTKAAELAKDPVSKGVALRQLGTVHYELGQFPQAEKAYLASLEANGNDAATLNNLAYLYASDMDQASKALPYAAKSAQMTPNNPEILDTYGWALAKSGDYVQAEKQLSRALQLSSGPAALALVRYHLGWSCEKAGRPEEAARHYRQGLDLLGSSSDPLSKDLTEGLARVQQAAVGSP